MLNLESGKKGAPAEPVGYWECPSFGLAKLHPTKVTKDGNSRSGKNSQAAPVEGL